MKTYPTPGLRLRVILKIWCQSRDHNDSSGGNGIHFDATPGTGTIGSTDEYIEIYNGTATPVDLTNWSLSMIDGTDVTQSLNSGWDTFFSQSGSLTNFQSGERLVLGNPTGDIKNTVQILLYNDLNELVDDVDIADSNATSISDEAYSLDESGNWGMSESSLGF